MTASTNVPMKEFLLWNNCTNNCQFCWQRKLDKPEMDLTEEEKLQAITDVRYEISGLPYTDILIVGGEVYSSHSPEVNQALQDLFQVINGRIRAGMTRQLYANTNLLYSDRTVLVSLLEAFRGNEDKLRLTTSYDIYGRYATEESRQLFLSNLMFIATNYPDVKPVVNCILTKQMCQHIVSGAFRIGEFYNQYNLAFINFIPYIAIDKNDVMFPTWAEVTEALLYIDTVIPHYLRYYCDQLDFLQDRVLKEYHKDVGFVECTSEYLECGHNSNYTRATEDDSCFVCKMKSTIAFEMHSENIDQVITDHLANGGKIATVGDVCTHYVWTHFGCPDWFVFDGNSMEDVDVMALVRQHNVPKVISHNGDMFLSEELDNAICEVLPKDTPIGVYVIGEEDAALFSMMRHAPKGTLIISGDPHDKCMKYTLVQSDNGEEYSSDMKNVEMECEENVKHDSPDDPLNKVIDEVTP